MMMITNRYLAVSISFLTLAMLYPITSMAQALEQSPDFDPPVIEHQADTTFLAGGVSQVISVKVTDNKAVERVVLFYRVIGSSSYQEKLMNASIQPDTYIADLSAAESRAPGLEYYFEAQDISGNSIQEGYPLSPLTLSISAGFIDSPVEPTPDPPVGSSKKWLWIGLGALAAGALASSGGGGSSSGAAGDVPLTINAGEPQ